MLPGGILATILLLLYIKLCGGAGFMLAFVFSSSSTMHVTSQASQ